MIGMPTIGVFLGSNSGKNKLFEETAAELGQAIARNNCDLICGASNTGLMGVLMQTVLHEKGVVTAVLPLNMEGVEVPNSAVSKIIKVANTEDRKQTIRDIADALIVLPGGIGTLDEFFQSYSMKKNGIFKKPIGILNIAEFYSPMIEQVRNVIAQEFAKEKHQDLILVDTDAANLLARLLSS